MSLTKWRSTDSTYHDRGSDNDNDRIEVVDDIVRDTIELHSGALSVLHSSNTSIGKQEDGNEEKDTASSDGLLDLLDEQVIPEHFASVDGTVTSFDVRWFGRIPKGISTSEQVLPAAVAHTEGEDLARLGEDGTLGRCFVKLLACPQQNWSQRIL